ncbi:MAG: antiterminator LoaP [Spirochaetales bacterium]|nr:antiterminator LoaP [Spirochaetales bacterium]
MEVYVCQVKTGEEQKFIQLYSALQSAFALDMVIHSPRRELTIRRAGKLLKETKPLFPGYLFIEAEDMEPARFRSLRSTPGFFRMLPENSRIRPLDADTRYILGQLVHHGEVLGLSQVQFQEDGKIRVLSGPLEGLEGHLVKVNRRKRRARIRLDLYETAHLVDLGFEELEPLQEPQK